MREWLVRAVWLCRKSRKKKVGRSDAAHTSPHRSRSQQPAPTGSKALTIEAAYGEGRGTKRAHSGTSSTSNGAALDPASASSPAKRVRTNSHRTSPHGGLAFDPIRLWLAQIQSGGAAPPAAGAGETTTTTTTTQQGKLNVLFSLQALAFFAELHPQHAAAALGASRHFEPLEVLAEVSRSGDSEAAAWATVTLACIAETVSHSTASAPSGGSSGEGRRKAHELKKRDAAGIASWAGWEGVWQLIVKRVALPQHSRAAACLALTMLRNRLVDAQAVAGSLGAALLALSSQAVTRPSGTLCAFACQALAICNQHRTLVDASVFRAPVSLLQSLWIPGLANLSATGADIAAVGHCATPDLLALLARVCGLEATPSLTRPTACIEQSAAYQHLIASARQKRMLDYLLFAKVDLGQERGAVRSSSSQASASRTSASDLLDMPMEPESVAARLHDGLLIAVRSIYDGLFGPGLRVGGASQVETLHIAQLRQAIDAAVLGMLFHALLRLNGLAAPADLLIHSLRLLNPPLRELANTSRTASDRAIAAAALMPLTIVAPPIAPLPSIASPEEYYVLRVTTTASRTSRSDQNSTLLYFKRSFATIEEDSALVDLQKTLSSLVPALVPARASASQQMQDHDSDSMDEDEPDREPAESLTSPSISLDEIGPGSMANHAIDAAFRALSLICTCSRSSSSFGNIDPRLLFTSADAEFAQVAALVPIVLEADRAGTLRLEEEHLLEIVTFFGEEVLRKHQYSHDALTHEMLLQILMAMLTRHKAFCRDSIEVRDFCRWLMTGVAKSRPIFDWRNMGRITLLLYTLLRDEALTEVWEPDGECITPNHPISIMQSLTVAPDFRVRYEAAAHMAGIFNELNTIGLTAEADLKAQLDGIMKGHHSLESHLTRLLVLTNMAVLSSSQRSQLIGGLVVAAVRYRQQEPYVKRLIAAFSRRLSFGSPRSVYRAFAGQLVYALPQDLLDPLSISWTTFDFSTQAEMVHANFPAVGLTLLEMQSSLPAYEGKFRVFCKQGKIESKVALALCRPHIMAFELCDSIDVLGGTRMDRVNKADAWSNALEGLARCEGSQPESQALVRSIQACRDELAATCVTMSYFKEPVLEDESIVDGLAPEARVEADILKKVAKPTADIRDTRTLHEPTRPFHSAAAAVLALRVLHAHAGGIFDEMTLFHIFSRLFHDLSVTQLTNDRIRIMRGVQVVVAMSYGPISKSPALKTLLMRRLTVTLADADLVPVAAATLAWVWTSSQCGMAQHGPAWVVSLVQASVHASALAEKKESNTRHKDLGNKLHNCVLNVLKRASAQQGEVLLQVLSVLMFATGFTAEESKQLEHCSLAHFLSAMAEHPKLVLNASALQCIASLLKHSTQEDVADFAQGGLWMLKIQLDGTNTDHLDQVANARIFADILTRCGGHLSMPDALHCEGLHALLHRRRATALNVFTDRKLRTERMLFACIVATHLDAWHEPECIADRDFYEGLRSFVQQDGVLQEIEKAFTDGTDPTSQDLLDQLTLLALPTANTPPQAEVLPLESALKDATLLEDEDYPAWIRNACASLCLEVQLTCNKLPGKGSEHRRAAKALEMLQPALLKHGQLAHRVFPLLFTYWLGLVFEAPEGSTTAVEIAGLVSTALVPVTRSDRVPRLLIESVLLFRGWNIGSSDPAKTQWLQSLALETCAAKASQCGLYSASLLFLELGADRDAAIAQSGDAAVILRTIYENVDDPDGFYSLSDDGHNNMLIDVLQHEGKWQVAFEMSAAWYEVGQQMGHSFESTSLTQPLGQLGYHALASDLTRASTSAPSSVNGLYDVAWQAGRWDLPTVDAQAEAGSGQTLYTVLRALQHGQGWQQAEETLSLAADTQLRGIATCVSEPSRALRKTCLELLGVAQAIRWTDCAAGEPMTVKAARKMGESTSKSGELLHDVE